MHRRRIVLHGDVPTPLSPLQAAVSTRAAGRSRRPVARRSRSLPYEVAGTPPPATSPNQRRPSTSTAERLWRPRPPGEPATLDASCGSWDGVGCPDLARSQCAEFDSSAAKPAPDSSVVELGNSRADHTPGRVIDRSLVRYAVFVRRASAVNSTGPTCERTWDVGSVEFTD